MVAHQFFAFNFVSHFIYHLQIVLILQLKPSIPLKILRVSIKIRLNDNIKADLAMNFYFMIWVYTTTGLFYDLMAKVKNRKTCHRSQVEREKEIVHGNLILILDPI